MTTQGIQCRADLYEMTDLDLIRIATALQEQAFKLQMTFLKKKSDEIKEKQALLAAEKFKNRVDGNLK